MKNYRVHYSIRGVRTLLPLHVNIDSESKESITKEIILSKTKWNGIKKIDDIKIHKIRFNDQKSSIYPYFAI